MTSSVVVSSSSFQLTTTTGDWAKSGEGSAVASAKVMENSRATSEVCRATPQAVSVVEVEQMRCECCGLVEECTPAYVTKVRGLYCGRWVCGLCGEAVKEEQRGRTAGGRIEEEQTLDEGLEHALEAHTSFCMQFNNYERTSPVVHLAKAMRRILRRSLDGGSGSRSAPGSPRRSAVSRSSSCISSIPRQFGATL